MNNNILRRLCIPVFVAVLLFGLIGVAAQQANAMTVYSSSYATSEKGQGDSTVQPSDNSDDQAHSNSGMKLVLTLLVKKVNTVEKGVIVFHSFRDNNDELYSMNEDGTNVTRLTNNSAVDVEPDWSPDGSKIAFSSNRTGEYEIYTMNADGSNQVQLTTMTHSYSPQWSPDGTKIAFYTRQSNNNIIYTMNPDGSGLFQVTDPAMSGDAPYWSPDGTKIAFTSARTIPGIYVIDADGTDQSLLLMGSDIAYFAWSPDGTKLALSKTVTPNYNFDLFIYDIGLGVTIRLTDTDRNHNSVDWSPEGDDLIFHANLDSLSNYDVYRLNLAGMFLQNLTNNPAADDSADWGK